MDIDQKVNKTKNLLYTSGIGIIIFSVWSAIKVMMTFIFNASTLEGIQYLNIVIVITLIVVLIDIRIHLYVGLNAMKAAKGARIKKRALFLTAFLLVNSILLEFFVAYFMYGENLNFDTVISFITDVVQNLILLEVIIYSFRLHKFRKMGY